MIQLFDKFNQAEQPYVILCNPNKEQLYDLKTAKSKKIRWKYNALSEFDFEYAQSIDNGSTILPAYELLTEKRLILIENFGYFIINEVQEDLKGSVPIKSIFCSSVEGELIHKQITELTGTMKFYDSVSPQNSLLGYVVSLIPSWSIGTVDSTLWNKYRTFDSKSTTIYSFLMTDVESAYGCIFKFDTVNKTISAYSTINATSATDIFLSHDNLLKSGKLKNISNEITTCLHCYGAGDLDIRTVNPLGTTAIYDFSYYKTTQWMSQGLIDALTAWESLVDSQQTPYANLLSDLKTKNAEMIVLQGQLVDLQNDYISIEGVQKARIQAGQTYADITTQLNAKQSEINAKNAEITAKQNQIDADKASLSAINDLVSFESNFTSDQLKELSDYKYENNYQNENIIQTDSMTPVQVQEQAQELYDQGRAVFSNIAQPRYEFDVDVVNFLTLKEYENFIGQLDLGSVITIELREDFYIETVLLEIDMSFDNPSDFSMIFSNRLRLDNGRYVYSDLLGQMQKTSNNVSTSKLIWDNWNSEYKDDVSTFITSALDASKNNVVNAANQEILIGQNGLRGRTYDVNTQTYKNTQVWLTSNTLAFTGNNWSSASLALGEITWNGNKYFGVVGDAIVGRIVAGNQLTITNPNNNFVLDGNGAILNNASFTIQNNNNAIVMTPGSKTVNGQVVQGFAIQSNISGSWRNTFYVDTNGNVNFAGNLAGASGSFSGTISANSGSIGGFDINPYGWPSGIYTTDKNNYLRANGDMKWGAFKVEGGNSVFNGTFSADKIIGQINGGQIQNGAIGDNHVNGLSAGKISAGTMSGDRIYGGVISGPGITIRLSDTGAPLIQGSGSLTLEGNGASIGIGGGSNAISLNGPNGVYAYGGMTVYGGLTVSGGFSPSSISTGSVSCSDLYVGWGNFHSGAYSGTVFVGPSYTNKQLNYSNGLLTSWS